MNGQDLTCFLLINSKLNELLMENMYIRIQI